MPHSLSVLIKPASSLCNLRCKYCFYADVSENRSVTSTGVMDEETTEKLTERIAEHLDGRGQAVITFQGGEPTVAGLSYFRHFVKCMERYPEISVQYGIQTNGTLLDEEWASFLAEHRFLVGFSLDGYESNMDEFRYDAKGKGVFFRVLKGIELCEKAGVAYNILTVVTSQLAKHPEALYRFFASHHYEYIQLIPCLPGLEEEKNGMSLTPELYASFYAKFFDCWKKGTEEGIVMNVNLFENVAGMLQGIPPYQCGMIGKCMIQYVIEGNGDVYPCDFYCLDEYRMGNLKELSFAELAGKEGAVLFLEGQDCKKGPCENCPYLSICNGGCRRQNTCYLTETDCAYRKVLDHIVPEIWKMLKRR